MRNTLLTGLLAVGCTAAPALAIDREHRERAETMIADAIGFLRTQQHESGGWGVRDGDAPQLPAITGLVVTGMAMDPGIDANDESVRNAVRFMLGYAREDGGIYDRILPSYNTSICLAAIARLDTPETVAIVPPAQRFLRGLQYSEEAGVGSVADETTARVDPDHPFYGGIGYGSHSRPDSSNLFFMLEALEASGVDAEDPSVERAVTFLERTQMLDEVNDMPYADGSSQGGFVYSTGPEGHLAGIGESKAGVIEETIDDGTRVSRLRAYGSMTYAGFKSYAYADIPAGDPRVEAAMGWITRNYTLEENPGIGQEGLYYYFVTFAKALDALGSETIEITNDDGEPETRDWANDLIARLAELQDDDGGFRSVNDRWMENDRVLITAYALIALQHSTQ